MLKRFIYSNVQADFLNNNQIFKQQLIIYQINSYEQKI